MTQDRTSAEAILANCDEVGDCLEWRGPYGRGRSSVTPIVKVRIDGQTQNLPVVRLMWEHTRGPIPPGKIVYRTCCNHRCVQCLKLGVRGDAHRQRRKLGLSAHRPETVASITNSARTRATTTNTMEKARECRALSAQGLRDHEVAALTGVHADVVADIRRGDAWRESAPGASVFSWRPDQRT